MFRQVVFFQRASNFWGGLTSMFFTLGICFVALGLLILEFPRILAAMVASLFIVSGMFFLAFAWKDWQFRRGVTKKGGQYWSN